MRGILIAASVLVIGAGVWLAGHGVFGNRDPAKIDLKTADLTKRIRTGYYREIVKLRHGDEDIEINVVVSCAYPVGKKFGTAAVETFPHFYAVRTKDGHAVGLRPTMGCSGQTTENGGAPPDLLPSIYWLPDADDFSFAIFYATEDAYANPLSQLKFRGATMHAASAEEFAAFERRVDAERSKPQPREVAVAHAESPPVMLSQIVANNGRYPKPWHGYPGEAFGMMKFTLSEEARAIVREFWPASRPRYWLVMDGTPTHKAMWDKFSEIRWRNASIFDTGGAFRDYTWQYYTPDVDGLQTRAGGGRLGRWHLDNTAAKADPQKVPTVYPFYDNTMMRFYNPSDSRVIYVIDTRAGDAKGFEYAGISFRSLAGLKKPDPAYPITEFKKLPPPVPDEVNAISQASRQARDHFLHNFSHPARIEVDGVPVDMSLWTEGTDPGDNVRLNIFERDTGLFWRSSHF